MTSANQQKSFQSTQRGQTSTQPSKSLYSHFKSIQDSLSPESMCVGLGSDSKLATGVDVSMKGCLSPCVSPVTVLAPTGYTLDSFCKPNSLKQKWVMNLAIVSWLLSTSPSHPNTITCGIKKHVSSQIDGWHYVTTSICFYTIYELHSRDSIELHHSGVGEGLDLSLWRPVYCELGKAPAPLTALVRWKINEGLLLQFCEKKCYLWRTASDWHFGHMPLSVFSLNIQER